MNKKKVIYLFTAHAVSHKGMVNNHKNCQILFGHGMEPKIFWSADRQEGLMDKGFTKDLNPDGCLMQ